MTDQSMAIRLLNSQCLLLDPKPAFYAVRDACRPVLASARNYKFTWKKQEQFITQLWILNDRYRSMEGGW